MNIMISLSADWGQLYLSRGQIYTYNTCRKFKKNDVSDFEISL